MSMIQYQLWNHCNNHCLFCSQQGSKDKDKVGNLKRIISLLDNKEILDYNSIGLIGGELFDFKYNNEIRKEFYNLIDKISKIILDKQHPIKKLFVMTNFLYKRDIELNNFLNYIDNIKESVIFCTSWDVKGRFHNQNSLDLFDDNFSFMKENKYNLHIEIILSGEFLESINNEKIKLKDLYEKYTDNIDFIIPHNGENESFQAFENFFPKRKVFIEFLEKEFLKKKELYFERFLSRNNHSNLVYELDKEGNFFKVENRVSIFGTMPQDNCSNYSDDNIHHMYTDFINFKEVFKL